VTFLSCRLLALDIDGTLLRSDKTVSARTRRTLRAAQEQGVRIVLITGRRLPAARRVVHQLTADGGPRMVDLVLHNGALVVEFGEDGDHAVVRCRPLAREVAVRAVRVGRAQRADPVVHCGHGGEGRLLVEGTDPSNTLLAYYLDRSHPDVREVEDLVESLREDPLQVMFGGSMAQMESLLPPLRAELGAAARIERTLYPRLDVSLLDVLEPGVGKAEALSWLCARFGVEAGETMAIGDNWNDHEMLEQAGRGFVMGNADPGMLSLGLPVLDSNDEDGVALAVERYILEA
jgi:hypothetical protein